MKKAVRGLLRAQSLLFEKLRTWSRVAMGAVPIAFGLSPVFGTPQRVFYIVLGVWLLLGWNIVIKVQADAVLKQHGSTGGHVIYRFVEGEIQAGDSGSWRYEGLLHLAKNMQRSYLFRNLQIATVVNMGAL